MFDGESVFWGDGIAGLAKQILLSNATWTIVEILMIILLTVLIIFQSRKKKEYIERAQVNLAKNRNKTLEENLKNPEANIQERTGRNFMR